MKVGIVGIGLIGGSLARDFRSVGHSIFGYDQNEQHCDQALDLKIADEIMPLELLAKECDILFVSIPVHATVDAVSQLLNTISWNGIVVDTSSTKATICKALQDHPKRGRYIASHPLAGTEYSGPKAAIDGLFAGKKNIICDEHLSDDDALDAVIGLLESIGLQNLFMNPVEHDRHMAYVSHLSHVSAFMLGTTVLEIEEDQKQIFNLASTGFESTVRLAKSSPETWSSIFSDNSDNVLTALDSYISHLKKFRSAIESKNVSEMTEMMQKANNIRRALNGMKYKTIKLS